MLKLIYSYILIFSISPVFSQNILISTNLGNITIKLYDDTPFHQENFMDLVAHHFYDSLLFHRVIKNFMIQTGDPDSRTAKPAQFLGRGSVDYTIPAEFQKNYFHKKGAVAAARLSDNINPARESSGSQFYIVTGRKYTDQQLDQMESSGSHIKFTAEQRNIYKTTGGAPSLDYAYTVFGEVISGFDVIEKISSVLTDDNDRPLNDIRINTIRIIK